jgi:release factor glutamine methyltransferase
VNRITVGEILVSATEHFRKHGIESARLDAEVLLAHVLGEERIKLYVDYAKPLQNEEVAAYRRLVARRLQNVPVAYLVGYKEFNGIRFKVDRNTLIPRPETEHLVEAVCDYLNTCGESDERIVALDMCTGSGAIAISLALEFPNLSVVAVDISTPALRVARENATALGVSDRVHFQRSDMFDRLPVDKLGEKFDAVVANPPYLSREEMRSLHPDIAKSEPLIALDGGSDGLRFQRVLVARAADYLKPGGLLALEIGASQGSEVAGMLQASGMYEGISILPDYAGLDRVVTACKRLS